MSIEKEVHFFDMDGTLLFSPLPDPGKDIYAQKKGKPFPHIGWWSKPESLDQEIFDIPTKPEIDAIYREVHKDENKHAILLTNRIFRLENEAKKVLHSHGMYFEHYSFKNNNHEKGQRILAIMTKYYPDVKNIVFYDDDQKHLDNAIEVLGHLDFNLKLVKVSSDLDYLNQN